MQKIYGFAFLALCFNSISSVDLQAWGDRLSPVVEQALIEISTGFLHCGFFILMTMWISIAETNGNPKYSWRREFFQNLACVIAFVGGVLSGILEWALAPSYGARDGDVSAAKHIITSSLELIYLIAGVVAASKVLRRLCSSRQNQQVTEEATRVYTEMAHTIVKYLIVITIIIGIKVAYSIFKASSDIGTVSYRFPPCVAAEAVIFESQVIILAAALLFMAIAKPKAPWDVCFLRSPRTASKRPKSSSSGASIEAKAFSQYNPSISVDSAPASIDGPPPGSIGAKSISWQETDYGDNADEADMLEESRVY